MPSLLLTITAIEPEADINRTNRAAATAQRQNGGLAEGSAYSVKRDSVLIEQRVIYSGDACMLPLATVAAANCFGPHDLSASRAAGTHDTLLRGGYACHKLPITNTDHPTADVYATFQWLTDGSTDGRYNSPKTDINARI